MATQPASYSVHLYNWFGKMISLTALEQDRSLTSAATGEIQSFWFPFVYAKFKKIHIQWDPYLDFWKALTLLACFARKYITVYFILYC